MIAFPVNAVLTFVTRFENFKTRIRFCRNEFWFLQNAWGYPLSKTRDEKPRSSWRLLPLKSWRHKFITRVIARVFNRPRVCHHLIPEKRDFVPRYLIQLRPYTSPASRAGPGRAVMRKFIMCSFAHVHAFARRRCIEYYQVWWSKKYLLKGIYRYFRNACSFHKWQLF